LFLICGLEMKGIKKLIIYWVPVFICMGLMWYLSSKPVSDPSILAILKIPFMDKVMHIAEYAVFGYLLARALAVGREDESRILLAIIVIALSVIWGVIDELHQMFVPMRYASIFDVIADTFGASLGSVIVIARGEWARDYRKYGEAHEQ